MPHFVQTDFRHGFEHGFRQFNEAEPPEQWDDRTTEQRAADAYDKLFPSARDIAIGHEVMKALTRLAWMYGYTVGYDSAFGFNRDYQNSLDDDLGDIAPQ
jgi:hypothetical protein